MMLFQANSIDWNFQNNEEIRAPGSHKNGFGSRDQTFDSWTNIDLLHLLLSSEKLQMYLSYASLPVPSLEDLKALKLIDSLKLLCNFLRK